MANLQHFPLPDVGEGLTEAEILNWRVQPGDQVEVNQVIVEIETAKAAVELPCPWAGTVRELLAEPGQTVEVGTPIVAIDVAGEVEVVEQGAAPAAESTQQEEKVATLVGYGPRASSTKRRRRRNA
ncbi:biotin/lipoyl-containing protein, partial [Saccharopolyspora rectivirgula]